MVAMNVWPTDAADGSVANEARWRKMARGWMPSGVLMQGDGTGAEFNPTLAFPNLTVGAGAAWVDGHFCELPGSQVLTVTANGLVVIRFDPAANTAELLYRDGATTPAVNPTGTTEIPLYLISGSALQDQRLYVHPKLAGGYAGPAGAVANTPQPRLGYTFFDGTTGRQLFYRAGRWLPAQGEPVGFYGTQIMDANLNNPAVVDLNFVGPLTFPYDVTVQAFANTIWGFGATAPIDVELKIMALIDGSQPAASGLQRCYLGGRWVSTPLYAQWSIPAGADARFKIQFNFNNGSGGNCHTGGFVSGTYFAL